VDHPNALAAARQRNPAVLHQARTAQAVNAVMAAGFDVNARAGGSTALHEAAFVGDVTLIAALLDAGADPSLLDDENRSTPLGWAQYAHQGAAAQMLAAVTPE
jgi:ankyrin repeat protein